MVELGRADRDVPSSGVAGSGAFRPALSHLLIAALLVVGTIVYWLTLPDAGDARVPSASASDWTPSPAQSEPQLAALAAPASSARAPIPGPVLQNEPREGDADPTTDLRAYMNPGDNPTLGEVITRLHQAGVHTGIGAFNPPNTRPRLVGLAVPDDYVLPDGYVRHYQATDDGQPLEPILMYAPDRQIVDAAGRPVAVPANRVVPPEQAPPGLPIRRIVIPAPAVPDKSTN